MAKSIPKVHFYLSSPKAKNETAIVLVIGHNKNRIKHNTPIAINPKYWDKKECIKSTHTDFIKLNRLLSNIKKTVNDYYINCADRLEQPNFEHLKSKLPANINNTEPKNFFYECFDKYTKAQNQIVKIGTLKSYYTILEHIKAIEEHYNFKISFNAIDYEFEEHLRDYCFNIKSHLSSNYNKLLKNLKAFLNWSTDKEYNQNLTYKKFKKFAEPDNDIIVLNDIELKSIECLELDKSLNNYRNLFLIECYTGLRYSDLKHIKKENVKDDFLLITQTKTSTPVRIPILKNINKLITAQTFKEVPSMQKFNEALKIIGGLANLNEEIERVDFKGNKRITTKVIKKDKISTHTGRRTFCTMALRKGMNPHEIMKITGHKKIEVFNKYLRITSNELKTSLNKAFE
jgi:integrase